MDEAQFDEIKMYERSDAIDEKHKIMLRLVDAHLMNPQGGIDDTLRAQLLEHYSADQLVALTLKVVGYTSQKMLVVLGVDLPFDRPGGARTPEGLRMSEHENYINVLGGDTVNLPVAPPGAARLARSGGGDAVADG